MKQILFVALCFYTFCSFGDTARKLDLDKFGFGRDKPSDSGTGNNGQGGQKVGPVDCLAIDLSCRNDELPLDVDGDCVCMPKCDNNGDCKGLPCSNPGKMRCVDIGNEHERVCRCIVTCGRKQHCAKYCSGKGRGNPMCHEVEEYCQCKKDLV